MRMDKDGHSAIRAVLAGNKEAYAALFVRHSAKIFLAFRITGNEADAEDVVQEAWLRGYQKLQSFESRADFDTWIYRIAVRCALDRIAGSRAAETMEWGPGETLIADHEAGMRITAATDAVAVASSMPASVNIVCA